MSNSSPCISWPQVFSCSPPISWTAPELLSLSLFLSTSLLKLRHATGSVFCLLPFCCTLSWIRSTCSVISTVTSAIRTEPRSYARSGSIILTVIISVWMLPPHLRRLVPQSGVLCFSLKAEWLTAVHTWVVTQPVPEHGFPLRVMQSGHCNYISKLRTQLTTPASVLE